MSIIYALVARERTVLAEYTPRSGNHVTTTRLVLGRINPAVDTKAAYSSDGYLFCTLVEDGLIYLCLVETKSPRIAFAFLDDVKSRFAPLKSRAKTVIAYALNSEFARVLQDRMEFFNNNPSADNLGRVREQLKEVKDVMVQNIEQVLARGEKIELLVDKTEALSASARTFHKQSKALKNVMWWKNVKLWIMIAAIVLVIIWLISSFACGFDYGKCRSS